MVFVVENTLVMVSCCQRRVRAHPGKVQLIISSRRFLVRVGPRKRATGRAAADAPRLIDATTAVLRACLQPHPDALAEATTELDELMKKWQGEKPYDPRKGM